MMTMIPLHLIPDQTLMSPFLAHDGAVSLPDLGLSIAGPVDGAQLEAFQILMQRAGLSLQPTRMLYDRLYAFERLVEAHADGGPVLRQLALQLFERYQRAGEWIGLMH